MLNSKSKPAARPKLACEISADGVLAGRVSQDGRMLDMYAGVRLPSGSVVPDLVESNVRQREDVSRSIREALAAVDGHTHDVIAVLPDASVRVVLLDFDALPTNRQEAESVVRFRLKKSMPFDVEKARVSYHSQTSGQGVRAIVAVALLSVIEDYEQSFVEAGYSPGVVLPSMLAALGAADAARPTMVIKVDARTTSIAIVDSGQVMLFRTLENTRGTKVGGEQLADDIYPSVVFFQDTYNLNIEKILVAGLPGPDSAQALKAQTGAEVQELVRENHLGTSGGGSVPKYRLAGVVGALVS